MSTAEQVSLKKYEKNAIKMVENIESKGAETVVHNLREEKMWRDAESYR